MECFRNANCHQDIQRLLITNAQEHPGTGHYFETRQYYMELREDEILESAVLIAGMSMLYSLLMQPEQSEYWYSRLKEYQSNSPKGSSEYREARSRRAYLDIALPHRGSSSMIHIIKNVAVRIMDKHLALPEFSVTSNLPSIMNGGKDFSEWSRADRELAATIAKPVELVLGDWGAGLVSIALAESFFEKGQTDYYQIMTLLNSGYTKADIGGKVEMCFVATAILSRIHITKNQPGQARQLLQQFANKAMDENAERLLPNLNAFINNLNLLEGRLSDVNAWLTEEAPNEYENFYILDRYRYMSKVRSYLTIGNEEAALNLIIRLSVYFTEYRRTYMNMENEVLKAITQYRLEITEWRETLMKVLRQIERYHFVYLIAREGIAIRKLLLQLKKESGRLPVKKEFEKELLKQVNQMAVNYPNYLAIHTMLTDDLSEMERKIIHLYSQGIKMDEVCSLCGFSYNTLKYHNRNIYRKLGVTSRIEAVQRAKELKL